MDSQVRYTITGAHLIPIMIATSRAGAGARQEQDNY
jgi:hypothetical protein